MYTSEATALSRRVHEFDRRMRCYLWNDIFDAHRDDGKRFVVHADEKLRAFLELESTVQGSTFTI
jgi:hypothetical protein